MCWGLKAAAIDGGSRLDTTTNAERCLRPQQPQQVIPPARVEFSSIYTEQKQTYSQQHRAGDERGVREGRLIAVIKAATRN